VLHVKRAVLLYTALAAAVLSGCDSCSRDRRTSKPEPKVECTSDRDCADDNACTHEECRAGTCATTFANDGTNCDNANVCDGVSKCDGQGKCRTGPAPVVDDGNACTIDSCDPARGAAHEAVAIDDFDECTRDACDPRTGHIVHDSVTLDDGDDCTFDSCDPKEGVKHRQPNAFHTCDKGCGEGFRAAAKKANAKCGSDQALETLCAPSCGKSFYSCDPGCPAGYEKRSVMMNDVCGSKTSPQIFCVKG
jgi:hypothetical protein